MDAQRIVRWKKCYVDVGLMQNEREQPCQDVGCADGRTGPVAQGQQDAAEGLSKSRETSRARLLEAQRLTRMGDFVWDVETGQVTWSDALFELLGYDKTEEIDLARVNAEIHHPDDVERVRQWLGHCIASNKAELASNEYRLICKDGQVIDVWAVVAVQRQPDESTRVFGTVQDITERKETEQALQESRRQLATLMSNLPGMAYRCLNEPDWPMEFVSEGSLALTGYPPGELIGPDEPAYGQLIHPDDRAMVWEGVQEALRGNKPFVLEYRLHNRQGNERWVWEQGRGVMDPTGRIVALEGFISDITERKRTEMALAESEERFRRALENIPDVVVIYDRDLRIRYINAATRRLTGRPTSFYIGKRDEELWPKEQYECYLPTLHEAFRTGQIRSVETEFKLPEGGRTYVLRVTCVPLADDSGNVREVLGITHDLTERRRNEQRVRQAQERLLEQQRHEKARVQEELDKAQDKLIRATRLAAIGQVSASIAHELRNPLGAVHNAAYLLKHYLRNPEEKLVRQLQVIDQEIRRSNQIITNLLDLARAKEPNKRDVSLNQLVEHIMTETALTEGVTWRLTTDPTPFFVRVDLPQFRQVVQNLLTNAVEAMAGAGQFSIEARREGPYNVICFCDTGPGFSNEIPGDPLEPLVTTKTTGTGLGLTICRDIITRHGGTIQIENNAKPGAVVRIVLPQA